ncbi:CPBP family intramembrane glutamic endopeptidase [Nocardioides aequoreus]|uniref:CPBP family intramembrane glutamic endopeptidase n=1 Tax=Nocardioides aequoreus TaxID=397278 RepID=UPI0004C46297|nr:CPBP family intramembrane glutamic endopeptidase [Nocardioides aequoreus]
MRQVSRLRAGLRSYLRSSLWEMTPRDHRQSDREFRRRQLVSAVVVVIGAVVLGFTLRFIDPEDFGRFYAATALLAGVWAVGAFASGPLHLGRIGNPAEPDLVAPRPVLQPLLLGAALALVFVAGAYLITEVPFLDRNLTPFIASVLEHTQQGSAVVLLLVTVVNGIAEELFFRGAMYAAIRRHQVAWTTLAYTIATLATGNVMLGFAAVVVGAIVGLQRRASGGILAPIITHLTWSVTMLYALPAVFL